MSLFDAQIDPGKPRKPLKDGIPPFSRMNFSTAWSTSIVVAPGCAVSTASFSACCLHRAGSGHLVELFGSL